MKGDARDKPSTAFDGPRRILRLEVVITFLPDIGMRPKLSVREQMIALDRISILADIDSRQSVRYR